MWKNWKTIRFYFNSHAHVERDLEYSDSRGQTGKVFQLTRSRGAWRSIIPFIGFSPIFQLTRSRGAWHYETNDITISLSFQLTRSRGAWPVGFGACLHSPQFQLTRSRGAWLEIVTTTDQGIVISTHTLTWSVTARTNIVRQSDIISTHTLTWSVTSMLIFWAIRLLAFQLTRSRGAWHGLNDEEA